MSTEARVRVDLDKVCLGSVCSYDISDSRGILLLGSGQPLTESVRDQVLGRGVSFLEVHPDDVDSILGKNRSKAKAKRSQSESTFVNQRIDRSHEPYAKERTERFASIMTEAIDTIKNIGEQIESLSPGAVSELCEITNSMTSMALEDSDQAIALMTDQRKASISVRCIKLASLAINTGIEMGISDSDIVSLGTAGLLHDMSLFLLPETMQDPTKALSSNEEWEFRKHPRITEQIFGKYKMIPPEICLIMSQVHERIDGSGYPLGIRSRALHPLSRILNLVDTYLTLVSPGPGRPAVLPYDAIALLLHEGQRGRFDVAAMRALLTTLSLFPIGSNVELSNGQSATVIRRDGTNYAQPVVQTDNDGQSVQIAIKDSPHSILRPIIADPRSQMRLTPEMTETFTLDLLEC